jgi:hypothetical protein
MFVLSRDVGTHIETQIGIAIVVNPDKTGYNMRTATNRGDV